MRTMLGLRRLLLLCFSLMACSESYGVTVNSSFSFAGGVTWEASYILIVSESDPAFDELTIYFDSNVASNLHISGTPAGWDSLIAQPDSGLPADGFIDSLRLNGSVPNGRFGGFSVLFDTVSLSSFLTQRFEVLRSSDFVTVGSGFTEIAAVPEPAIYKSLCLGLIALLLYGKRARLFWKLSGDRSEQSD